MGDSLKDGDGGVRVVREETVIPKTRCINDSDGSQGHRGTCSSSPPLRDRPRKVSWTPEFKVRKRLLTVPLVLE